MKVYSLIETHVLLGTTKVLGVYASHKEAREAFKEANPCLDNFWREFHIHESEL